MKSDCRGCWSYHGEQNGTHRAGALGPGLGAFVGLVLDLDWASFVVWPAVIGVLQIRKRFDVKTTDWVDFLGFLGTFLFVIYDMENGCQGQSLPSQENE